jgi:transglutaminase-like putative cysteine protease
MAVGSGTRAPSAAGWGMAPGWASVTASVWLVSAMLSSAVAQDSRQDTKPSTPLSYETTSVVVIRPDRTSRTTHTVRVRINQESALATAGQATLSYTDSMETLSVVEAYTLKPDGTKLAVDPATILTRDAASGQSAVYLRDAKTKTLIFPSIAVDDTLVYTSVRDVVQTSFDGHFTYGWVFNRSLPWTAAKHTLEAPAAVTLNIALRGDTDSSGLTHVSDTIGDITRHVFEFKPASAPMREETGAVAAADRDPGFTATTFPDVKSLGDAYWRDAKPKAAITPEIQALADEIIRGQTTTRAKVDAIDRWVKRNVRYVAVYLGRERWVPHPAAQVLVNRYGDCKDHAALLTALLQAAGIASAHVLINLGTSYTLPDLPPGPFNHVIVHVPAADLYLDPTATLSAFGVLSLQTYDKPVVHAGDAGIRLARTPPMAAIDHVTRATTLASIAADGSIEGTTTQTATGIFATSARAAYLRFQGQGFAAAAEARLLALGTQGTGGFQASSPSELREPYVVTASFKLTEKMALPLTGSRRMPVGLPVHARPSTFLLNTRVADRKQAFICFAGTQHEDLELSFADGLALPRVPQARTIETKAFKFTATYALDGRTFKVQRTFVSRVTGQVCSAALETEIEKPLKDVQDSLGTVLVFGPAAAGSQKKK